VGSVKLINNIINQRGTPAFNSNTLANRPAAGYVGRIFISTDTFVIQRDNGTTWDNIGGGGGGISGSGAAGQVTFWTGASAVSGDNAFHWDNVNKRLGLGTIAPGVRLDIHGTGVLQQLNGTTTNNAYLDFQNAGATQWRLGNTYNGGNRLFQIIDQVGSRNTILVNNNGQFGINMPTTSFLGINSSAELHYTTNQFIYRYFSYSSLGLGVQLAGIYTRSNTPGTFSATTNGDVLLNLSTQGSTNTAYTNVSGSLRFLQNGTVGASFVPVNMDIILDNGTGATGYSILFNCTGFGRISGRLNVNNATDNALFELNNNGNFYTGGLSPTILTVNANTTMARTVTGYYVTATATLTLPSAASLNNVYWIIAASGVTVTVNRAGSDDILNLAGTSVTSITITSNQRAMFYVGGGTRTFLISQA
jgi:hypothetical protein